MGGIYPQVREGRSFEGRGVDTRLSWTGVSLQQHQEKNLVEKLVRGQYQDNIDLICNKKSHRRMKRGHWICIPLFLLSSLFICCMIVARCWSNTTFSSILSSSFILLTSTFSSCLSSVFSSILRLSMLFLICKLIVDTSPSLSCCKFQILSKNNKILMYRDTTWFSKLTCRTALGLTLLDRSSTFSVQGTPEQQT